MRLVDVHSHIHFCDFDKDRELILSRAKDIGVIAIITSTLRFSEILRALDIIEQHPNLVFLSVGLDPAILDPMEMKKVMEFIEQFPDELVAIGEVGLDYFLIRSSILREVQRQNFVKWVILASKLDLPLVIHSRRAGRIVVNILSRLNYSKIILHAFDGSVDDVQRARKLGMYFSIPPSVVYSKQKQRLVRCLDLDEILLESDAPLLGPIRGLRNEPSNIVKVVEKIAEIKDISVCDVAEATIRNVKALFGNRLPLG